MQINKSDLRVELKKLRDNIINKEEKQKLIYKNLLKLIEKETIVLIYLSTGSEVDTFELCKTLLENNVKVYAPRCLSESDMVFLQVKSIDDLEIDKFGIYAPKSNLPQIKNTKGVFCIVPGLGFGLNGERIGYGKGYYDRFLHKNDVKSVGVCFQEQIRSDIPCDEFDVKLNYVVNEIFVKNVM